MTKKQFNKFLRDQKRKGYSVALIITHLKDGWEEIENECTCQYDKAKKHIGEKGLVHNKNCPKG